MGPRLRGQSKEPSPDLLQESVSTASGSTNSNCNRQPSSTSAQTASTQGSQSSTTEKKKKSSQSSERNRKHRLVVIGMSLSFSSTSLPFSESSLAFARPTHHCSNVHPIITVYGFFFPSKFVASITLLCELDGEIHRTILLTVAGCIKQLSFSNRRWLSCTECRRFHFLSLPVSKTSWFQTADT